MNDQPSGDRHTEWTAPGYHAVRDLGTGATGRVVQAVHDGTGLAVAIKYLSSLVRNDTQLLGRFRKEARTLEVVDSPHVVALYEYVETCDGVALVMELVEGVELRELLRAHAPLPTEAALAVLKGSLLGLAAAHGHGLVHRDYKPGNVMVGADGVSRLVDFGIAVRQGESTAAAGTPAYMPPEQWQGLPPSPQADVYAATATFFECLTGTPPFLGTTVSEVAAQHLDAPVPLGRVRGEVHSLLLRGLAKSPTERPGSAEEFVGELETVARSVCGDDWENRGRSALAGLIALLGLLPRSGEDASGGSDSATSVLERPDGAPVRSAAPRPRGTPGARWRAGLAAGSAVLALGAVASMATQNGGGTDHRRPSAGQSAGPVTESRAPGAEPPPTQAADGQPPASGGDMEPGAVGAAVTARPVISDVTSSPVAEEAPSATAGPSAPHTEAAEATPEAGTTATGSGAAPPHVGFVGVTGFTPGNNSRATATISVTTDSPAPVKLTVRWYDAYQDSGSSAPGDADGPAQTLVLQGSTSYSIDVEHSFDTFNCTSYRGVRATTAPGAQAARPYRSGWTAACLPR